MLPLGNTVGAPGGQLVVEAEACLEKGDVARAEELITCFHRLDPEPNQFLCRAHLCRARVEFQRVQAAAAFNKGERFVSDIVRCVDFVMMAMDVVEAAPSSADYDFLVRNVALVLRVVARPLARPGYGTHVSSQVNRVVARLAAIPRKQGDDTQLIEYYLFAAACDPAPPPSKHVAAAGALLSAQVPWPLLEKVLRHDASLVKRVEAFLPGAAAIAELQRKQPSVRDALAGLRRELAQVSPQDDKPRWAFLLSVSGSLSRAAVRLEQHDLADECVHLAAQTRQLGLCKAWILGEFTVAEQIVMRHPREQDTADIKERVRAVRVLETALVSAVRLGDADVIEDGCVLAWNMCLPLLQAKWRKFAQRLLRHCATALDDIDSALYALRVSLHFEMARCEMQDDFLDKAISHLNRAMRLDYTTPVALLPPDVQVLPLFGGTGGKSSKKGAAAAAAAAKKKKGKGEKKSNDDQHDDEVEHKVRDSDKVNFQRPLDRYMLPLHHRLDIKTNIYTEPSTPIDRTIQLLEQCRDSTNPSIRRSLVSRAADMLRNMDDEGDVCAPLWFAAAKLSWGEKMAELALFACGRVLDYEWHITYDREFLLQQADAHFVACRALASLPFTERNEERLLHHVVSATELGLYINEPSVVTNASTLLWNSHTQAVRALLQRGEPLPNSVHATLLKCHEALQPSSGDIFFSMSVALAASLELNESHADAVRVCEGVFRCELGTVPPQVLVDCLAVVSHDGTPHKGAVPSNVPGIAAGVAAVTHFKPKELSSVIKAMREPPRTPLTEAELTVQVQLWARLTSLALEAGDTDNAITCAKQCLETRPRVHILSDERERKQPSSSSGAAASPTPDRDERVAWASGENDNKSHAGGDDDDDMSVGDDEDDDDNAPPTASTTRSQRRERKEAAKRDAVSAARWRWYAIGESAYGEVILSVLDEKTQNRTSQDRISRLALERFTTAAHLVTMKPGPDAFELLMRFVELFWNAAVSFMDSALSRRVLTGLCRVVVHSVNRVTTDGETRAADLRLAMYQLFLQCLADEGLWEEGHRESEAASARVPQAHLTGILQFSIVFLSKLGRDVTLAVGKVRQKDPLIQAQMWNSVAKAAAVPLQQFQFRHKALTALANSDPLEAVEYLVDYGEWLFLSGFPLRDAEDQLFLAADILHDVEPDAMELEDDARSVGTSVRGSSISGSVRGSGVRSVARRTSSHSPSRQPAKRALQKRTKSKSIYSARSRDRSVASSSVAGRTITKLNVNHLSTLARIYTMLALMASDVAQRTELCVVAQYYVLRMWTASIERANELVRMRTVEALDETREFRTEHERLKFVKQEMKKHEGDPDAFALPRSGQEWIEFAPPEELRRVWKEDGQVSLTKPTMLVYYMQVLTDLLLESDYQMQAVPVLALQHLIGEDVLQMRALASLVNQTRAVLYHALGAHEMAQRCEAAAQPILPTPEEIVVFNQEVERAEQLGAMARGHQQQQKQQRQQQWSVSWKEFGGEFPVRALWVRSARLLVRRGQFEPAKVLLAHTRRHCVAFQDREHDGWCDRLSGEMAFLEGRIQEACEWELKAQQFNGDTAYWRAGIVRLVQYLAACARRVTLPRGEVPLERAAAVLDQSMGFFRKREGLDSKRTLAMCQVLRAVLRLVPDGCSLPFALDEVACVRLAPAADEWFGVTDLSRLSAAAVSRALADLDEAIATMEALGDETPRIQCLRLKARLLLAPHVVRAFEDDHTVEHTCEKLLLRAVGALRFAHACASQRLFRCKPPVLDHMKLHLAPERLLGVVSGELAQTLAALVEHREAGKRDDDARRTRLAAAGGGGGGQSASRADDGKDEDMLEFFAKKFEDVFGEVDDPDSAENSDMRAQSALLASSALALLRSEQPNTDSSHHQRCGGVPLLVLDAPVVATWDVDRLRSTLAQEETTKQQEEESAQQQSKKKKKKKTATKKKAATATQEDEEDESEDDDGVALVPASLRMSASHAMGTFDWKTAEDACMRLADAAGANDTRKAAMFVALAQGFATVAAVRHLIRFCAADTNPLRLALQRVEAVDDDSMIAQLRAYVYGHRSLAACPRGPSLDDAESEFGEIVASLPPDTLVVTVHPYQDRYLYVSAVDGELQRATRLELFEEERATLLALERDWTDLVRARHTAVTADGAAAASVFVQESEQQEAAFVERLANVFEPLWDVLAVDATERRVVFVTTGKGLFALPWERLPCWSRATCFSRELSVQWMAVHARRSAGEPVAEVSAVVDARGEDESSALDTLLEDADGVHGKERVATATDLEAGISEHDAFVVAAFGAVLAQLNPERTVGLAASATQLVYLADRVTNEASHHRLAKDAVPRGLLWRRVLVSDVYAAALLYSGVVGARTVLMHRYAIAPHACAAEVRVVWDELEAGKEVGAAVASWRAFVAPVEEEEEDDEEEKNKKQKKTAAAVAKSASVASLHAASGGGGDGDARASLVVRDFDRFNVIVCGDATLSLTASKKKNKNKNKKTQQKKTTKKKK